MATVAHRHKPFDWLSADVSRRIFLVMDLRRSAAAIHTFVTVALQDERTFTFPVVRIEIIIAVVPRAPLTPLIPCPLIENDSNSCENTHQNDDRQPWVMGIEARDDNYF